MIIPGIDISKVIFYKDYPWKNPFHAAKTIYFIFYYSKYDYLASYTIIQFLIITPLIIYTLFAVNFVVIDNINNICLTTLVLFLNFKKNLINNGKLCSH